MGFFVCLVSVNLMTIWEASAEVTVEHATAGGGNRNTEVALQWSIQISHLYYGVSRTSKYFNIFWLTWFL